LNFIEAITEMYPRIPWKPVANRLASAEHLGTTALDFKKSEAILKKQKLYYRLLSRAVPRQSY
jgi:hypothetical protein